MAKPARQRDYLHQGRNDRRIQELHHDPYHLKRKLPESAVCLDCNARFQGGRWIWGRPPENAQEETCPACQRLRDKVPAGFLTLRGDFFTTHRDEIMRLIRNTETRLKTIRPLMRIMNMEKQDDSLVITFTDPHLARSVGEALHKAYQGELNFNYPKGEYMIRVHWTR